MLPVRLTGGGFQPAFRRNPKHHPDVRYLGGMEEIKTHLLKETAPGDLVLTMGAGDIFRVGEEFLQAQRARGHI